MVTSTSEDAIIGSRFAVELDGVQMAYFQAVSGFSNETELIDDKVVGANGETLIRKLPGQLTWGPITLTRGLTSDMELWNWRQAVITGDTQNMRRNGSIIMYNHNHEEVVRYDFTDAWPSKWTGPAAKADDTAVAVEELEIQYESLERRS